MRRISVCLVALVSLVAVQHPASAAVVTPPTSGCSSHASGDFNGDGHDDLAVGTPFADVGGKTDAGAVNIIYGSVGGLSDPNNQLITQDTVGTIDPTQSVEDVAEAGDHFGACLSAGFFFAGGDDASSLAVGVPGEDVGTVKDAGAVHIFPAVSGVGRSRVRPALDAELDGRTRRIGDGRCIRIRAGRRRLQS